MLCEMAKSEGIFFWSFWDVFTNRNNDLYENDGLHLNKNGSARLEAHLNRVYDEFSKENFRREKSLNILK